MFGDPIRPWSMFCAEGCEVTQRILRDNLDILIGFSGLNGVYQLNDVWSLMQECCIIDQQALKSG